jgi:hypothetical protein
MTKNNFEQKLFELNNKELLQHDKRVSVDYETQKVTHLHLYYNDNGHIGTWQKGSNVIFEERLPKEVA